MATGTGETFITVAQIYRLLESDLARRLLMSRSTSQDAERHMLAKLKNGKLGDDIVIFKR